MSNFLAKRDKYILFALNCCTVLLFYLYVNNLPQQTKFSNLSSLNISEQNTLNFISEKITEYDIQHPDIVLAQSILESSIHKNNIVKNNNLFGMKSAWVRKTVALNPKTYEYAKYSSIDSSILDYKLWQIQYANNLTRQQYLLKLEQIYASDTLYVKKLLNIIKNESKYRNFKNNK